MENIEKYAKKHSLDAIKDFLESYNDWNDDTKLLKKDIELIYKTVEGQDKEILIKCDTEMSYKHPHIFEVLGKYNLIKVQEEALKSYSIELLCQVLLNIAHYLKDSVIGNEIRRVANTTVDTVAKQVLKRGAESLLGIE